MPDKNLSQQVLHYKSVLADGNVQATYQKLVGILQNIRTSFAKEYKDEYSAASVMHGYIDYTYFYLQNDFLKSKKLKLAVVLNHSQANFELWLLGQTKAVQKYYWQALQSEKWVDQKAMPEYSIFETSLLNNPAFDNIESIVTVIHKEFSLMASDIHEMLTRYD